MLRPSWCVRERVTIAKCNLFFACNSSAAITPNHGSMNRLLRLHNCRFLRWVSVRAVVFQHTTGEHVTMYRPSSDIYVQENIFIISFHHFSALLSNQARGSNTILQNFITLRAISSHFYLLDVATKQFKLEESTSSMMLVEYRQFICRRHSVTDKLLSPIVTNYAVIFKVKHILCNFDKRSGFVCGFRTLAGSTRVELTLKFLESKESRILGISCVRLKIALNVRRVFGTVLRSR